MKRRTKKLSLTLDGSSQDLSPSNEGRTFLRIQAPSTNADPVYVDDSGADATADNRCIEIQPGDGLFYEAPAYVPSARISVIGTSGDKIFADER